MKNYKGKKLPRISKKQVTRTTCAFEVAAQDLNGSTYLDPTVLKSARKRHRKYSKFSEESTRNQNTDTDKGDRVENLPNTQEFRMEWS